MTLPVSLGCDRQRLGTILKGRGRGLHGSADSSKGLPYAASSVSGMVWDSFSGMVSKSFFGYWSLFLIRESFGQNMRPLYPTLSGLIGSKLVEMSQHYTGGLGALLQSAVEQSPRPLHRRRTSIAIASPGTLIPGDVGADNDTLAVI